MSAFFLGQAVRKARGKWNVGSTGVVSSFDHGDPFGMTLGVVMNQPITAEQYGVEISVAAGVEVYGYPDDFEPVLPGGLETNEEIESLWEPAPVQVLA